jgi:DNA repair protein RadC
MVYLKDSKIQVVGSCQVAKMFRELLLADDVIDQAKEHFYVMHLDIRSRINMVELVSLGILSSSIVHPRETYRRAVMQGSSSIVVAHNHPSGQADPSEEDMKVTKVLLEAGRMLGIDLQDHIIFTDKSFFSFKNNKEQEI